MSIFNRLLRYVSILIVLGYLGIGLFLYMYQRDFLYHPTANISTKYKTLTLHNDGASINVLILNEGHENAILYFGGNAESMARSSDYIAGQFPNFTVYLMDYRGYGSSTGVPTEKNIYLDALTLYDTIKPTHQLVSIGGRSLGTGVATYVAAHRIVSKLALITPYDSIVNVAKDRYPFYPVAWLLMDKYDSVSRIKNITAKTFIVLAQNDQVISLERTQKLIEAFHAEQLEIEIIKNRGHMDISSDDSYYRLMQNFIGEG